jgi:hypothetical protein
VFSFVETFAGEAQATMAFRSSDFRSARLDLKYMSAEADRCNPMDLCTPPGFAKLDFKKNTWLTFSQLNIIIITIQSSTVYVLVVTCFPILFSGSIRFAAQDSIGNHFARRCG